MNQPSFRRSCCPAPPEPLVFLSAGKMHRGGQGFTGSDPLKNERTQEEQGMKTTSISMIKKAKSTIRITLCTLAAVVILVPLSAPAEEGGSGHYMPGANASFVDALPGRPGPAVANFFAFYDASVHVSKLGGLVVAGIDATAYADTVLALCRTPLNLLGGYYVVGVAVPYVWMEVEGEVQFINPKTGSTVTRRVRDTASGFGDITVYPFMLGWTGLGGDLKYDIRLGVYVPTGDYVKGDIANVGKNYWTFEPAVSFSYISSRMGLELTAFAGFSINTKNDDTDYRTGNQLHLDVTVAEHLPLFGGLMGLGASGCYYDQVSGDSGSGAVLGDFEGRSASVGPVLSYATKIGKKDFVAELKWLHEFDVTNRLEGDYVWFKLALLL
mgnify:CR=1 FL=1